jgi:hypothetical protein
MIIPITAPGKIDPVARPVIDAHLGDATADRLPVAQVAHRCPLDASHNPVSGDGIVQPDHPAAESIGFDDLDHGMRVNYSGRMSTIVFDPGVSFWTT